MNALGLVHSRLGSVMVAQLAMMLASSLAVWGQDVKIPDGRFEVMLRRLPEIPDTGAITAKDLASISGELDVSRAGILDLSGVEYMSGITTLTCYQNRLTNLDVSRLASLEELSCDHNDLVTLTVTGLPKLRMIAVSSNKLTSVHLDALPSLRHLSCDGNRLSSLDLTRVPSLEVLDCMDNGLTRLNISGLGSLTTVSVGVNKLTELNLSGAKKLHFLNCQHNLLTVLDLRNASDLCHLLCSDNSGLESLELPEPCNVQYLDMSKTRVRNVSFLRGVSKMRRLTIGADFVTDLSPLVENKGFVNAMLFILKPGAVDPKDLTEKMLSQVKVLQQRGIQVGVSDSMGGP